MADSNTSTSSVPTTELAHSAIITDALKIMNDPKLSDQQSQSLIESRSKAISLKHVDTIINIDRAVSERRDTVSRERMNAVLDRGSEEASKLLNEMIATIDGVEPGVEKRSVVQRSMDFIGRKKRDVISVIRTQYTDAEPKIERIAEKLRSAIEETKIDTEKAQHYHDILGRDLQEQKVNLAALTKYLNEKKDRRAELEEAAKNGGSEEISTLKEFDDAYRQGTDKIADLMATIEDIKNDMALQRILITGSYDLIASLRDALNNQIPLFRNQFATMATMESANRHLDAARKLKETNSKLRKRVADETGRYMISQAQANAEGSIDIKSITDSRDTLIESLNKARQVYIDTQKKKEENYKQLRDSEERFKRTILNQNSPADQIANGVNGVSNHTSSNGKLDDF